MPTLPTGRRASHGRAWFAPGSRTEPGVADRTRRPELWAAQSRQAPLPTTDTPPHVRTLALSGSLRALSFNASLLQKAEPAPWR